MAVFPLDVPLCECVSTFAEHSMNCMITADYLRLSSAVYGT